MQSSAEQMRGESVYDSRAYEASAVVTLALSRGGTYYRMHTLFFGINNDGAAFVRFFGGCFGGACAPFSVPTGIVFLASISSVSSVGAGRFKLVFCPRRSTALLDEGAALGGGAVALPLLPADFIARGVTKLSGIAGWDVSTGRILDCVFGAFVEDCGLFDVVGAVK